jgi:glycolate oxidase
VITNDLNEAVRRHGLFYAGYPMSLETCFIGGNVAENAGGGRAIKYGVTGRYVLGLEVVLPTGEIVQLGGKRVKDVTGYDLLHLMVGSEGTLGIFTRIILRLLPLPIARMVTLVPFADVPDAIAAVPNVMTRSGIVPAAVEFMDRLSSETAYAHVGEKLPHPEMGALLLIEVDGSRAERVEADLNTLVDLCLEAGALDALVADTPAKIKKMWHPRQAVAEAFKVLCPVQSAEDLVMPMAQIPHLMPELARLSVQYNVLLPAFGHVGDGNIHVHVLKPPEAPLADYLTAMPALLEDLYKAVARLDGTISGEHGIGSKRAAYLPLVQDATLIELQRRIKRAFDPLNVLNPGKIFP